MATDQEFIAWVRREMGRGYGPLAMQYARWEGLIRGSLHPLATRLAGVLYDLFEDEQFDWGQFGDAEWLLEEGRTPEEVEAYTKGAKAFASWMVAVFEDSFDLDPDEFLTHAQRRERLEEAVSRILDSADRVEVGGLRGEPDDSVPAGAVLRSPQTQCRPQSGDGDSSEG